MWLLQFCKKTMQFLWEFRDTWFEKSLVVARELAEEIEMSPDEMVFANESAAHYRQVRKQFAYETDDESANFNPFEKIRTTFFLVVMDNAIASYSKRFQKMNEFIENFGFLFQIVNNRGAGTINDNALKAHSLSLQKVLS